MQMFPSPPRAAPHSPHSAMMSPSLICSTMSQTTATSSTIMTQVIDPLGQSINVAQPAMRPASPNHLFFPLPFEDQFRRPLRTCSLPPPSQSRTLHRPALLEPIHSTPDPSTPSPPIECTLPHHHHHAQPPRTTIIAISSPTTVRCHHHCHRRHHRQHHHYQHHHRHSFTLEKVG